MIIVKLLGGLGNHLFQYAAGLSLSVKHRVKLKFDQSLYEKYRSHAIGLHHFNVDCCFATQDEIEEFNPDSYWNKITGIFRNRKMLKEKYMHFDPDFYYCPPDTYLDGYWQSEKYFSNVKDGIRDDFKIKQKQIGKDKLLAAEMADVESVAVHVRRGNYLSTAAIYNVHGVCSREYYDKSVDYVASHLKTPHLYVFADDKQWARNNLRFKLDTTFIDHNNASLDYEDLRLMSQCKHQIIANSTFSWWAAWLNPVKDKIIIAPSRWYNDERKNEQTHDLIPENWVRL